jgi:hypothetical protein
VLKISIIDRKNKKVKIKKFFKHKRKDKEISEMPKKHKIPLKTQTNWTKSLVLKIGEKKSFKKKIYMPAGKRNWKKEVIWKNMLMQ